MFMIQYKLKLFLKIIKIAKLPQRLFSRNKIAYTAILNDIEYEKEISDFIVSSSKKANH